MVVRTLLLDQFRNHQNLHVQSTSQFNFIIGDNGIGKTNLVEAISLLAPGRGLRSVQLQDIIQYDKPKWTIFASVSYNDNQVEIGSEYGASSRKRIVTIDGKPTASAENLLKHIRVLWLLPSMDGILCESKSIKRKFFDRLTYNFFPEHATAIKKYESSLKARLRLLKDGNMDDILLQQYEKMLVEFSHQILKNRRNALNLISDSFNAFKSSFLRPSIMMHCICSDQFDHPDFRNFMLDGLKQSRRLDAKIGRSMFGPHRADYQITNTLKNISASTSSTGEQKAMLISLLIAQVIVLNKVFNIIPVLLLDDIFSHLDQSRSSDLLTELSALDAQVWITTTALDEDIIKTQCKNYIKIDI